MISANCDGAIWIDRVPVLESCLLPEWILNAAQLGNINARRPGSRFFRKMRYLQNSVSLGELILRGGVLKISPIVPSNYSIVEDENERLKITELMVSVEAIRKCV
jgi:hypothetical protein